MPKTSLPAETRPNGGHRNRPRGRLMPIGAVIALAAVVLAGCSSAGSAPAPNLTTPGTTADVTSANSGTTGDTGSSEVASSAAPAPSIADTALFATYSTSGTAITDTVTPDTDKNFVTTPAGSVSITQLGRVSDIDPAVDSAITGTIEQGETYVPAAGHHFVVFTVKAVPGWPTVDVEAAEGKDVPTGTIAFANGAATTDITEMMGFAVKPDLFTPTVEKQVTFVASVADDSPAAVVVGTAGHNQTITVDTATRTDDPDTAVYYMPNRQVAVNATSPVTKKSWEYTSSNGGVDPIDVTYGLTASTVTFTAYSAVDGWAPAGKMWVQVAVADKFDLGASDADSDYSAWTLTDTAGNAYKTTSNTLADKETGIATFLVPSTATELTASFGTELTVTSGFDDQKLEPHTLKASPAKFTAKLT